MYNFVAPRRRGSSTGTSWKRWYRGFWRCWSFHRCTGNDEEI